MGYEGWAIFMDCGMLCRTEHRRPLWALRDDRFAFSACSTTTSDGKNAKFLGKCRSAYQKELEPR